MPISNDLSVPPSKLSPKDEEAVFRLRLAKEKEASEFGRRFAREKSGKLRMGSLAGEKDYPALPFLDRTIIAAMDPSPKRDNDEVRAFLEKKYGKGSISTDKKGLLVTVGGKKMRVSTGFLADVTAQAPETALGVAGAVAGTAVGGVPGGVAGSVAGAMAGRTVKEAAKMATGVERKTAGGIAKSIGVAGGEGALGELGGAGAARGLGRVLRGPLPRFFSGGTPETEAMTAKFLQGGGMPPIGSALPSAKYLQRVVKKAEILTGKDTGATQKNVEYLQKRAGEILDKAGVIPAAKDKALASMVGSESALSYTESGRLVQSNAKMILAQVKNKQMRVDTKTRAYLEKLSAAGQTPEDAVSWLIEGGQRDRLERFIKVMGKNSVVVQSVQHQALKQVLADSLERTARDGGEALHKALQTFTEAQKKLLFPDGAAKDLALLASEMKFAFPKPSELGMPGWTAGSEFEKKFYVRWYYQGVAAVARMLMQHPWSIRRLALGFRGGRVQAEGARNALRTVFQESALGLPLPEESTQPPVDARHGIIKREAPAN